MSRSAGSKASSGQKLVLALAAVGLVCALVAFMARGWAAPEIPSYSAKGVDPLIVAAIEKASDAVRESPKDGKSWGVLGMVFLAHEFTGPAATCFADAARWDEKNAMWPYLHGRAVIQTDQQQARDLLEYAVDLCGNAPDAPRLRLVELLLEQREFAAAKKHLDSLLAEQPQNARGRVAAARLALLQGDAQTCHETLSKLDREIQQSYDSLLAEAKQRESQGELESAKTLKRQAELYLHGNTGQQQATELLWAQALLRLGRTELAEEHRQQALTEENRPWPDRYWDQLSEHATGLNHMLARADVLFGTEQYVAAETLLADIVRRYPDSLFARVYLGRSLIRRGQFAAARGDKEGAVRQYLAAEQQLQRALEIDAKSVDAMFRLGVATGYRGAVLGDTKLLQDSAAWYRRAVEEKPDFTMAHQNLAAQLFQLDDLAGALQAMQNVIALEPHNAAAQLRIADLLLRDGKPSQALEHAEAALEAEPNNAVARDLVRKLALEVRR